MKKNIANKLLLTPTTIASIIGIAFLPVLTYAEIASIQPTATNATPAASPNGTVNVTVKNPFPLSNTVSYDSLRMMAYSGQTEQAIKLAEDYLKHRENASIRTLLARMLAWNKQFDAAREQLQIVLKKHPGDFDASDTLADVEIWNGNYDRAIETISNALKYDPNDEQLLDKRELIRAKQFVANNQREKAIQLLQNYIGTHDAFELRVYLGNQLMDTKQYDAAKAQFEYVVRKKPTNSDAQAGLANVEIANGNYKHAIEIADNGLHYSPDSRVLLASKNDAQEKMKGPKPATINISPIDTSVKDTADSAAKKLQTLSSTSANSASSSGTSSGLPSSSGNATYEEIKLLSRTGQRNKAIKIAQNYLKTTDNSDIRIYLGAMLSWDQRYGEARKELETVLKQSPTNADASKALANVELWSDHEKRALEIINTALKYNPKDQELLLLKKRVLAAQTISYDELSKLAHSGQREKAKVLAQDFLSKSENADVRVLLGYMQYWDSNYDDARYQFQTVLRSKPSYTDASIGLANVEMSTDHYDAALQKINNALKYDPNNKTLLEKQASIIQNINEGGGISTGAFALYRLRNPFLAEQMGKKNSLSYVQEVSYVDDLKQTWKLASFQYSRDTSLGSIIFTYNEADRFQTRGTQYLLEAYPYLFDGAYMYLGYGYSNTSYFPRNYFGFEPFFSLPNAWELSAGERILQFQGGTTHLYTGSIGKYIGNYWFALRPYFSNTGSASYHFLARRYFSTPESYITLRIGGGDGPSDISDPQDLSSDMSRSIRLDGQVPLTDTLFFNWLVGYGYEHYPNTNVRQETLVDAGLTWIF